MAEVSTINITVFLAVHYTFGDRRALVGIQFYGSIFKIYQ